MRVSCNIQTVVPLSSSASGTKGMPVTRNFRYGKACLKTILGVPIKETEKTILLTYIPKVICVHPSVLLLLEIVVRWWTVFWMWLSISLFLFFIFFILWKNQDTGTRRPDKRGATVLGIVDSTPIQYSTSSVCAIDSCILASFVVKLMLLSVQYYYGKNCQID